LAVCKKEDARGLKIPVMSFEEFFTGFETSVDVKAYPRDPISIIYPSGTTGLSKGALGPHPRALQKMWTIREICQWDGYLLLEDFSGYPLDDRLWDHIEEDMPYVSAMLAEMERLLIRAAPFILERLGQSTAAEARMKEDSE
jgi:acyl-CoA synthetase (AMP-forming)/AMP-acid ligase II